MGKAGRLVELHFVINSLKCAINSSIKAKADLESLRVYVHEGREKLTVGVIYRPPNLSRQNTDTLIQEISRVCRSRNVCIMGDFNFKRVDWVNILGDL